MRTIAWMVFQLRASPAYVDAFEKGDECHWLLGRPVAML